MKNTGPSVLVVQVLIGTGSIRGDTNYHDILRDYACPSVERWATRCGYDYALVDRSDQKIPPQYLKHRLIGDHEYIVVVDADIVINDEAPPLQLQPGFGAVMDCDSFLWYQKLIGTVEVTNPDYVCYVNSGFTVADRESALIVQKFIEENYENSLREHWMDPIWDQHLVNYALALTDVHTYRIGEEWNFPYWYFFILPANDIPDKVWGVHFTGDDKKYINEKSYLSVL